MVCHLSFDQKYVITSTTQFTDNIVPLSRYNSEAKGRGSTWQRLLFDKCMLINIIYSSDILFQRFFFFFFEFYIDYYFCSRDVMEKAIGNGEFLEFAEYANNLYGTRCVLNMNSDGM